MNVRRAISPAPLLALLPLLALAAAMFSGCGAEQEPSADLHIGFQRHALGCFVTDLKARLEITNVSSPCPLELNDDGTVSGLCPKVPAGEPRAFRLVYYVIIMTTEPTEVQLATAVKTLDLTNETRSLVTLEFSQDDLDASFDFDNDHVTNLEEVCTGRNPLLMDP